jgi:hypothetical protein
MLLGDRDEKRPGEEIGKWLAPVFSFFVPAKYRAIQAKDVAKAMARIAKNNLEGIFIYEFSEIKKMIP